MSNIFKANKSDKYFNTGCQTVGGIVMIFAFLSFIKDCKKEKLPRPKYFDTGCFIADVDYYKESNEDYAHYTAIVYIDENNRLTKMDLLNGTEILKVIDSTDIHVVEYSEEGFTIYAGGMHMGYIEEPSGKRTPAGSYDEHYTVTVVGRPKEPCEYDLGHGHQ